VKGDIMGIRGNRDPLVSKEKEVRKEAQGTMEERVFKVYLDQGE
jgi:hypothetical protein